MADIDRQVTHRVTCSQCQRALEKERAIQMGMSIKIETKTNGYKAEGLQEMISKFDKVAGLLFPDCTVKHFYYGDYLDFAEISLGSGSYGSFIITAHRVSFKSHTCNEDEYKKFTMMTYRDELFVGLLLELAEEVQ